MLTITPEFSSVLVAGIGVFASVGFWTYLQNRQKAHDDKDNALVSMLTAELNQLKNKVDILLKDKEELLVEISTLRSELAATKAELHAVNNMLKYGRNTNNTMGD